MAGVDHHTLRTNYMVVTFLEELTVTQPVKKFPPLWKPKSHYGIRILNQLVPV
jgi:hypothetical protein